MISAALELIEWAPLDQLLGFGPAAADAFLEFVAAFEAERERLVRLFAARDLAEIARTAHRFRGGASAFGMVVLDMLAQNLENEALQGRLPRAETFTQLVAVFHESVALIRQRYPELTSGPESTLH